MKLLFLPFCFLLFLSCWLSSEAAAAPSVTIGPASDSVYVVQGNDFSGASGIEVTVSYDPTALASPQVVQGALVGGALMAINVSTPGKIRLALVRVTAINGSGTIATITFTRVKSTGADIQSVVSSAINSSGRSIPVTSQAMNSVKTADSNVSTEQHAEQPTNGASTSMVPGTPVTTAPSPVPGTPVTTATAPTGIVAMAVQSAGTSSSEVQGATPSADQQATDARQPNTDAIVPSEAAKDSSGEKMIAKAIEPERKKIMMFSSVLERFKDFKGEKTPKTLIALFSPQKGQARQDPPIVLSDGKTTMKVLLDVNPAGENNNFLLDGVSLVSLTNKDKNAWVAELLPDKKTTGATISIPRNNQWEVMPLTVAPPMDVKIDRSSDRLSEADFKLFLKEHGTAKAPKFDLNNDGRRDYIDDFIFTANYLVQRDGYTKQGTKVQK